MTMKHLVQENPFTSECAWVEGHILERKGRANCSLLEKVNNTANNLAKKVLVAGVASQQLIDS